MMLIQMWAFFDADKNNAQGFFFFFWEGGSVLIHLHFLGLVLAQGIFNLTASLVPVVQRVDSAIYRINHYQADNMMDVVNTYPLDSDLCRG